MGFKGILLGNPEGGKRSGEREQGRDAVPAKRDGTLRHATRTPLGRGTPSSQELECRKKSPPLWKPAEM